MSLFRTPSTLSVASSDGKLSTMSLPPTDLLIRDFGWPSASPRYRGDHTPDSNPDWNEDPLDCEGAKEAAFEKMEKSYKIYMGNLEGSRAGAKKEKRTIWARLLPWVR